MKISLFQYNIEFENKEKNKDRINELIDKYYNASDLIIFPEMSLTGFTMNSENLAESIPGKTTDFFSELAIKLNTNIFYGMIQKIDEYFYNSLVHTNPKGEIVRVYHKIHPFSFMNEDKYYKAGEQTKITEIGDWKIGLSICYDLRFPELFRLLVKNNAEIIVNIANWPKIRIEHYHLLLRARAIENLVFTIGVNRVGTDGYGIYSGNSIVFEPWGKELLKLNSDEGIHTIEINKSTLDETRKKYPFLNDIKLI